MRALVGQEVGPTEWRTLTQEDIDAFAELSGDHQWIHVDVERAKTESPFGTTIAHGNLTLATVDGFRGELIEATGFAMASTTAGTRFASRLPCPSTPASAPKPRSSPSRRKATAGTKS